MVDCKDFQTSTLREGTMGKLDMLCVSAYDSDSCVEEILEHFDPYIVTQVRNLAYRSSCLCHPAVLDLEIDEIVQEVRIKFWRVLRVKNIRSPKAYIKRIVYNEFVNYLRRRKLLLPLPMDEDGELYQGNLMITPSVGMSDPAYECEQAEALDDLLAQTADAVSDLPQRQQLAMLCSLKEQVDDLIQFVDVFTVHEIDVEVAQWPDDEIDLVRLKASISAARKKIERHMKAIARV